MEPARGGAADGDRACGEGPARPITRALVVEDSMIIAMDTEDNLHLLGVAEVVVASSVAGALEVIEQAPFDLALLDYNLGDESSEPVAERLASLAIPFWFVTGYGDAIDRQAGAKARGVLKKPFTLPDLERVVDEVRGM